MSWDPRFRGVYGAFLIVASLIVEGWGGVALAAIAVYVAFRRG